MPAAHRDGDTRLSGPRRSPEGGEKVKESGEDYLETILILRNRKGTVYSIDIAAEMQVSKASVSVAMKNLRESGYIQMGENREIYLTARGQEVAGDMYERHLLFADVLTRLGVDRQTALRDACHMEHAVSAESFAALKKHFLGCARILSDEGK